MHIVRIIALAYLNFLIVLSQISIYAEDLLLMQHLTHPSTLINDADIEYSTVILPHCFPKYFYLIHLVFPLIRQGNDPDVTF